MTTIPLWQELQYLSDELDKLRFDGMDQNPKGIRDLLYSASTKAKELGAERDDALAKLADAEDDAVALAANLQNCLKVLPQEDRQMCCDGRECGCYGATFHQEAEHYANEALAAHARRKGEG